MNVNMNQENMNENLRILSQMSEEELNNVLAQVSSLVKKMAHNDGQLTEEDLEQVAGGIGILGITAGVAAVGAVTYLVANMFKKTTVSAAPVVEEDPTARRLNELKTDFNANKAKCIGLMQELGMSAGGLENMSLYIG